MEYIRQDYDWLVDWILKAEGWDFEHLINRLEWDWMICFNYRWSQEENWGEVYIIKEIFINETEKYWADVYIDMDYYFSNNLEEFIKEIIWLNKKWLEIFKSFNT